MALPPGIAGTKRPFDLPPATSVSNIDAIVVDDGISVRKATARQIVENAAPFATQAQAEAGTDQTTYMNPLLTAQAIAAQAVLPVTLASNAGAGLIGTDSGQTVQDLLNASVSVPFSVAGYVNPPLEDAEMLYAFVFPQAVTFPADFSGSQFIGIEAPSATNTLEFFKVNSGDPITSTTLIGSLTYNTDGSFVFETAGNLPIGFAVGDAIIPQGQAVADATAAYSFTLIGAR